MKKVAVLWALMGAVYMILEGIWRGGWVHVAMLAAGGLCGVCIGAINQVPRFYNARIITQSAIGAAIVTAVEFTSGCVLNIWFGLGIWDYSGRAWNIMGQVCPAYALLWLVLMPFAIWLEDWLRWNLWGEGEPYTLSSVYLDFIKLK